MLQVIPSVHLGSGRMFPLLYIITDQMNGTHSLNMAYLYLPMMLSMQMQVCTGICYYYKLMKPWYYNWSSQDRRLRLMGFCWYALIYTIKLQWNMCYFGCPIPILWKIICKELTHVIWLYASVFCVWLWSLVHAILSGIKWYSTGLQCYTVYHEKIIIA